MMYNNHTHLLKGPIHALGLWVGWDFFQPQVEYLALLLDKFPESSIGPPRVHCHIIIGLHFFLQPVWLEDITW